MTREEAELYTFASGHTCNKQRFVSIKLQNGSYFQYNGTTRWSSQGIAQQVFISYLCNQKFSYKRTPEKYAMIKDIVLNMFKQGIFEFEKIEMLP